jgi:hypothetical protein
VVFHFEPIATETESASVAFEQRRDVQEQKPVPHDAPAILRKLKTSQDKQN